MRNSNAAREISPDLFVELLHEHSEQNSLGKANSRMLDIALLLKEGRGSDGARPAYRDASLQFIRTRLRNEPSENQDAFFRFLLQSELAEDSPEIRAELHRFIRGRLHRPFDRLTITAAGTLLRSNQIPSAVLASEIFGAVRSQYCASASWDLLGLLARCAGRVVGYTTSDLVDDIALLHTEDEERFSKAIRRRNAIWTSLPTPIDAIDIINLIGRRHGQSPHNFPIASKFGNVMDKAEANVVYD